MLSRPQTIRFCAWRTFLWIMQTHFNRFSSVYRYNINFSWNFIVFLSPPFAPDAFLVPCNEYSFDIYWRSSNAAGCCSNKSLSKQDDQYTGWCKKESSSVIQIKFCVKSIPSTTKFSMNIYHNRLPNLYEIGQRRKLPSNSCRICLVGQTAVTTY